jgi:hypothetical protein
MKKPVVYLLVAAFILICIYFFLSMKFKEHMTAQDAISAPYSYADAYNKNNNDLMGAGRGAAQPAQTTEKTKKR